MLSPVNNSDWEKHSERLERKARLLEGLDDSQLPYTEKWPQEHGNGFNDTSYPSPSREQRLTALEDLQAYQSQGLFKGDDLDVTPGVVQNLDFTAPEMAATKN